MSNQPSTSDQPNMSNQNNTSDQPGTGMGTDDVLTRRYQALLRAYPEAWRAERGDEMLGTLLDAARPAQRRPSVRESVSIVVQGMRERLAPRRRRTPGEVWSEGLRIGALVLLGQAFAAIPLFALEEGDLPARYAVAVPLGLAAMAALVLGRSVTATVLTGLWILAPVGRGEMPWEIVTAFAVLAGLSLADRSPRRQRTSAVWLLVVPAVMLLWFGNHLLTGAFLHPAGNLLYPFALLLAVTAGVLVDARLPIAVACPTVFIMLDNTLHVPALINGATIEGVPPVQLVPQTLVFAAIAVVLLTIGHVRARRLARI